MQTGRGWWALAGIGVRSGQRFPQNGRVVANPFAPTLFTKQRPESGAGLRALTRLVVWVCRCDFNSPEGTGYSAPVCQSG